MIKINKIIEEDLKLCPEPTYFFNVGDKVEVGSLVDPFVKEVLFDGKGYVIGYTKEGKEKDCENTFLWYNVRPITNTEESFLENQDVQLYYSNQTVRSLLTKFLSFGVDIAPFYQRDLVWTQEDKEKLIESVFHNVDIGKFVFIENDYRKDGLSYEILDGKQRLVALTDYYLNKFPYNGKYYNDLSWIDRKAFENHHVSVANLRDMDDNQKIRFFILLNTTGHVVEEAHLKKLKKILQIRGIIEREREKKRKKLKKGAMRTFCIVDLTDMIEVSA